MINKLLERKKKVAKTKEELKKKVVSKKKRDFVDPWGWCSTLGDDNPSLEIKGSIINGEFVLSDVIVLE